MLTLKEYNGNLIDIGMAEQFLLHLMDVPDYSTLLLGHLTRLQFDVNMGRVKAALTSMTSACGFILHSRHLRDLLHLVLRLGNFLNHVKSPLFLFFYLCHDFLEKKVSAYTVLPPYNNLPKCRENTVFFWN